MQRQTEESTVTVPVPDHPQVRIGTLQSIIRQSGLPRSLFEVDSPPAARGTCVPDARSPRGGDRVVEGGAALQAGDLEHLPVVERLLA